MSQPCPTPHKAIFDTRAQAVANIGQSRGPIKGQLRAYRCPCGYWHLTSQSSADNRRRKRELKRLQRLTPTDPPLTLAPRPTPAELEEDPT